MFFVCNFLPKVCPQCGRETRMGKSNISIDDFFHMASFSCECGAHYQYVPEDKIIEAAQQAGGDLNYRA